MTVLRLLERLASLAEALLALWAARRERRAGRAQAHLEQMEANHAAIGKAEAARARRRELDADPERLRADNGFRRD